ncbi:hypothetical protein D9758_009616 [Tetrapyrgos nigripes]|uniref:Gti1/Pac2 family-domain-containing protein n=1 Tax=Tetrapyrgos nigripes TaxID=182062 RepID=A0A8H5LMJ2_9AGAR|nr:hypothetical protein D9758_009616 [Tetrapyrgos nigripes]
MVQSQCNQGTFRMSFRSVYLNPKHENDLDMTPLSLRGLFERHLSFGFPCKTINGCLRGSLTTPSFYHSTSTKTMSYRPSHHSPDNGFVTHPSLHIRDAHDAHVLLEAVRLNILPLIKRRLVASEREQLTTGNVFVWEEAEDDGGLLRWTDGRRWSQSRMRGDYLFYEEKVETTQEEREAKAARRARRASDPNAIIAPPTRRKDRPSKPDGLTKQTYSVIVHFPGTSETRKWHVVAYFSGNDYSRLPVIEDFDYLRRIRVPSGIFQNSKSPGSRLDSSDGQTGEAGDDQEVMLYDHRYRESPRSPSRSGSFYANAYPPPLSPPLPGDKSQRVALPPLSALGYYPERPRLVHSHTAPRESRKPPPDTYTPLSSEDLRALQSFRIGL